MKKQFNPKKVKLPKTLWATIRLALKDLNKAEKTEGYEVYMGTWHEASGHEAYKSCEVCFAGGIMAEKCGYNKNIKLMPDDFNEVTEKKFEALDSIRKYPDEGDLAIRIAIMNFYRLRPMSLYGFLDKIDYYKLAEIIKKRVPKGQTYHDNKTVFKRTMMKLSTQLKKYDI